MRKNDILYLGVSKADITPDHGIQLAGDIGRNRACNNIRDRLFARVFIFRSGETFAALVCGDLNRIRHASALEFRRSIGIIPAENIIFHCSQSHSAPCVGPFLMDRGHRIPEKFFWIHGYSPEYDAFVFKALRKAFREALKKMEPVTVSYGRTTDGRCSFNRRFRMRDGTSRTHPATGDPEILFGEGIIDPEVSIALFRNSKKEVVGGLSHFTCHPTHGYPNRYVSADWPGLWSEFLSQKTGRTIGCLNGFCGNIAPVNPLDPEFDKSKNLEKMLGFLSADSETILKEMKELPALPFTISSKTLSIPWKKTSRKDLADAETFLHSHPSPTFLDSEKTRIDWTWVLAVRTLDKAWSMEREPSCPVEIQRLRIGNLIIIAWPGEPFVEAQLELKKRLYPFVVICAHECNGRDIGYIPTRTAIRNGGYEVAIGCQTPSGTLEKLTEETLKI